MNQRFAHLRRARLAPVAPFRMLTGRLIALVPFAAALLATVLGCGDRGSDRGPDVAAVSRLSQAIVTPSALKGIVPDVSLLEPGHDTLIYEGRVERAGINVVWEYWQPHKMFPGPDGNCPAPYIAYDGHCFVVRDWDDRAIRHYHTSGVKVTAYVVGTPHWAADPQCAHYGAISEFGGEWWCAPQHDRDYARFTEFLASHYGSMIDSYIIGNEVNAASWFDIGCTGPQGSFQTCYNNQTWVNQWVQRYANLYNAAYDAITAKQPSARVFIPLADSPPGELSTRTVSVKSPWKLVRSFASSTVDGQWLPHTFAKRYMGVRYVLVFTTTTSSWVAWKEVQAIDSGVNLALNKPVAVSTSPGTAAFAVDGSSSTAWNSGQGPPAWIYIDLQSNQGLTHINLQPAQNPGFTRHDVYVDATQYEITHLPNIPARAYLLNLIPRLGSRVWRIAYHPYNSPAYNPKFSPEDVLITMGNIGAEVGWLQKTYGQDNPGANDVYVTEFGYASNWISSDETTQSTLVCDSLRNAVGTPGLTSYLYFYHREPAWNSVGFDSMGLWRHSNSFKPAWYKWANANGPAPECGFQVTLSPGGGAPVLATQLKRYYNPSRNRHWQSTRIPAPLGFIDEGVIARLLRDPQSGTRRLYECRTTYDLHNLISMGPECEGQAPLGPIGHAYTTQVTGTVGLVRCAAGGGADHWIATGSPSVCSPWGTYEATLGYVYPP